MKASRMEHQLSRYNSGLPDMNIQNYEILFLILAFHHLILHLMKQILKASYSMCTGGLFFQRQSCQGMKTPLTCHWCKG